MYGKLIRKGGMSKDAMMLFEPFEFLGMRLENRAVSLPVVSNLATVDGFVTENRIHCTHCVEAPY